MAVRPRTLAGDLRRLARATCVALLAVAGALTLLACPSSNSGAPVHVGPPGLPLGQLTCSSEAEPDVNAVPQGGHLRIFFTIHDPNLEDRGRHLPVAFEVLGGTLPDPPTRADVDGVAEVLFVADTDYTGPAMVRFLQPDAHLICDVHFSVLHSACSIEAQVLGPGGFVVPGFDFDACGQTEDFVERDLTRRIVYRVSRRDPGTGLDVAAAGAVLVLSGTGMNFASMTIGPADAAGEIEAGDTNGDGFVDHPIAPAAGFSGLARVSAQLATDSDGDGLVDSFPCNTCNVSWEVVDPVCDDDGLPVTPVYRSASGTAKSAPLRPGESADVTASFEVGGVPVEGALVLAWADNGRINGSASPVTVETDAAGTVTVVYTPDVGFSGTDIVTLSTDPNGLTCTRTAQVQVTTCTFDVSFDTQPVTVGGSTEVTFTLTGVDPATAVGERVVFSATRGFISPPGPNIRTIEPDGQGGLAVTVLFTASQTTPGTGSISLSFIDGYACDTFTTTFPIVAP